MAFTNSLTKKNERVSVILLLSHKKNHSKGVASHSDENEQSCSQVNTKLFRSSLGVPHENEDTPVVLSDEKNTMLLF